MPPRSARLAQIEARLAGLVPQPDAHQSRLAACSRQDDRGVDSNLSELRIGQREQRVIAVCDLKLKRRRAGIHSLRLDERPGTSSGALVQSEAGVFASYRYLLSGILDRWVDETGLGITPTRSLGDTADLEGRLVRLARLDGAALGRSRHAGIVRAVAGEDVLRLGLATVREHRHENAAALELLRVPLGAFLRHP